MNLTLRSISFILRSVLEHALKSYDMDQRLYCPSEGRHAADFYRPRPGLNPRTLGSMADTLNTRLSTGFLHVSPRGVRSGSGAGLSPSSVVFLG
jgi:hypothetical protein